MNSTLALDLTATLSFDVRAFLPEFILCGAIVLLLLIRLIPRYDHWHMGWIALVLTSGALVAGVLQWPGFGWHEHLSPDAAKFLHAFDPRSDFGQGGRPSNDLFGGMLIFDNFTIFVKIFLYAFTALVIVLTLLTGIPDREDSADFYCLLLGAALGMTLMASSNHLLMVFLSVEMASVPSYALAGFLKGRRQSSEAALKYVVYGGGASGVMLYGISLVCGKFDSGYLPTIVREIGVGSTLADPVVIMGLTFLLAGIGFKLASVPFHFWCPDVFEGAAAEVGAFLSVASKGAAIALLARVVLGIAGLGGQFDQVDAWRKAADYLVPVLAVFAVATTTFGNLAAYGQTNLKRLLAYSTIAHAGFMMMGLAALNRAGAGAVLFYLIAYFFMNLGAFAVVAFMRNLNGGHEDLAYYRGFVYRCPVLVVMLGVFLLSLLGIPPLVGFTAKFQIFAVLYDAAQEYARLGKPQLYWTMLAVLLAGGLNTVISLFYYIKVLRVMVLEKTLEEVEDRAIEPKPAPVLQSIYASALALAILVLGLAWNPLAEATGPTQGVNTFRGTPAPAAPATKGPPGGKKG